MSRRLQALLGVLLLLLLANLWRHGRRVEAPAALAELPASLQAPQAVGARGDLFSFPTAVEAPRPARKPAAPLPTPVSAAAEPTPAPLPAPWRLAAVALGPAGPQALLQGPSGGPLNAVPGQRLDEQWTLESVLEDRAVIRRADGSRLTLPLLGAP